MACAGAIWFPGLDLENISYYRSIRLKQEMKSSDMYQNKNDFLG